MNKSSPIHIGHLVFFFNLPQRFGHRFISSFFGDHLNFAAALMAFFARRNGPADHLKHLTWLLVAIFFFGR